MGEFLIEFLVDTHGKKPWTTEGVSGNVSGGISEDVLELIRGEILKESLKKFLKILFCLISEKASGGIL